jgi:hypothetical protein
LPEESVMAKADDWYREYQRRQREREQNAKRVVDYVVPVLRFLGVERVTVDFDGAGDSGEVRPAVFAPAPGGAVPEGLGELILEACYGLLPGGWEINAGSFGTLTIDAAAGTHDLEQTFREEEEYDEVDEEGEE